MDKTSDLYKQYVKIMHEELRSAMGCTEPIAIAYAAAKARFVLGNLPDHIEVLVSGNIIKNVKSVVIPHTGGLRGIPAAVSVGVVAGKEDLEYEVISNVTEEQIKETAIYLEKTPIEIKWANTSHIFDIEIIVYSGKESASVRIVDYHTNIVSIKKNDKILFEREVITQEDGLTDRSILNVLGIIDFAESVDINDVKDILNRQINYNMAIAQEGISKTYGANIGKTILASRGNDINNKMAAYAAAGSDARMNGCEKPVIINSGSGNQGITASVPVIVYGKEINADMDKIYRALAFSNLCTIHLKTGIGTLSAYCGVVSAGASSGAGICYLEGGDFKAISYTLVNALAITSGIVCDGAKASCAAKISSAVDAGIMGYCMYKNGNHFHSGDGIVKKGLEHTIETVGLLARVGMSETDKEIIKLMLND